jgi:hypothetical protein
VPALTISVCPIISPWASTRRGLYSGEGAYSRMGLYSEVSGIFIVFHCCNEATTKPVHIQRV